MDKETLSNYGWIVICVLVLAVMIALAGPFGNFIADAVKSTTQGLFDVNQGALDAAGIAIDDNAFVEGNGGTIVDPEPEQTPQKGDTYEYGDYIYTYQMIRIVDGGESGVISPSDMGLSDFDGWHVSVKDTSKSTYGDILEILMGEPVVDMSFTYHYCTNLTQSPKIPNSITNMYGTFSNCYSLTDTGMPNIPSGVDDLFCTFIGCTALNDLSSFVIPANVTDISCAFQSCTALTKAPNITNGITIMHQAFCGCTALVNAPTIPESVKNLDGAFMGCDNLSGAITVHTNPESWQQFLYRTQITEVNGNTTMGEHFLLTKTSAEKNPTP